MISIFIFENTNQINDYKQTQRKCRGQKEIGINLNTRIIFPKIVSKNLT